MPALTWTVWVFLAAGAAWLGLITARGLRVRFPLRIGLALLFAGASIAVLLLVRTQYSSRPVDVRVDDPASGALVEGCRVRVSGTVSPSDARVGVAVRSETDNKWWIQPYVEATAGPEANRWSVEVFLGTTREGVGQNFLVVPLASTDPVFMDVVTGRHLWTSRRSVSVPSSGCPENFGATVPALPQLSKATGLVIRRER